MLGELTNKDRKPWTEEYEAGEKVETHYRAEWREGTVQGSKGDLLIVDVEDNGTGDVFKGRLTTRGAVRKASTR